MTTVVGENHASSGRWRHRLLSTRNEWSTDRGDFWQGLHPYRWKIRDNIASLVTCHMMRWLGKMMQTLVTKWQSYAAPTIRECWAKQGSHGKTRNGL
ncbi:hypothetical protein LSAT2_030365 [Lamellibrachia satsuma]|nr:hypothetical protein LSAT2_030365 [Lamellibrachia satsuma]